MAKILLIFLIIVSMIFSCSTERKNADEHNIPGSSENVHPFDSFIFVGMIEQNPGLYRYNIKEKKYSIFWLNKKEKVIELSHSEDRGKAFFLTAREFSNLPDSGLPFINEVKLYLINIETGEITFIEEIGNGLQVFLSWEDNNTFKIVLNSIDKTISNYLQQRTRLYNKFGKKMQDIMETYDITKQGYPLLPKPEINNVSSDGKYSIVSYGKDSVSIYLKNSENEKQFLITKTEQRIEQVKWRNKHLFFLTVIRDPGNGKKSGEPKLFIYSIDKKKILKILEEGVKDFLVVNDFLVFDDGLSIFIYNYVTGKIYDEIRISKGCGIGNVSYINYGT